MNYNKLFPVVLTIFLVFLSSCNNEFSKYQKKDKNDLEERHLMGNVKSVSQYYDGDLDDIRTYNKYGFITEFIDYSDGEIVEKINYTYNEFGKIARKETKNKRYHGVDITLFDEYGNEIEKSTEIFEVYDANSHLAVGKRLDYTYENNYDKLGGLISRKRLRRDGSCLLEERYNQHGNLSKVIEYDEDGSVFKYTDYSYFENMLFKEKRTFPQFDLRYSIFYYDQYGNLVRCEQLYEDGSFRSIREHIYDYKKHLVKVIEKSVVFHSWRSDLQIGDIVHYITLCENDEHGSILKEINTTYYPNEDISIPKEADEIKEFQYKYDNHGNVIYEKDNEGHEYKYKITYY